MGNKTDVTELIRLLRDTSNYGIDLAGQAADALESLTTQRPVAGHEAEEMIKKLEVLVMEDDDAVEEFWECYIENAISLITRQDFVIRTQQDRLDSLTQPTEDLLFHKLCALLDRIDVEEGSELAKLRFDIFEEHGMTIEWGGPISGRTQ